MLQRNLELGEVQIASRAIDEGLFCHIFRDDDQLVGCKDGYLFTLTADQAILFPLAQNTADRIEGGACHLGQVLSSEGDINQDSMV